jgi:cellulose synthase/poly-beta-1,6-N-acetylglucosamine synthase-like glycosyltransferase
MKVSIGIPAYNEENNIGQLLDSIERQRTQEVVIGEIIVVSSGSTDRTAEIVKAKYRNDKVFLFVESEREGKVSAINLFMRAAVNDICVLSNADIILEPDTIERLCLPFKDSSVGMTGARVIPTNDARTFVGFLCHFRWRMSHEVSLIRPVLGELVAFRNVIPLIPNTAADESSIEAAIKERQYEVVYVPEAIFHNHGALTLSDYIKQRRRIATGQLRLKTLTGYSASSQNISIMLSAMLKTLSFTWRSLCWTPAAILIEIYSRLLAYYDFYIKKSNPYIWDIAGTTKEGFGRLR